jgi:GTP-dependent phosphoenolpyruvate carboxykinase
MPAPRWVRKLRQRQRALSERYAVIQWRCFPFAAITWATIFDTGLKCNARFRKDAEGKFLWPGFSENIRILKWIVDRVRGRAQGKETPIGWIPDYESISWSGLQFSPEKFDALQSVDRQNWKSEVIEHEGLFIALHDHLPPEMIYERELLICRL